MDASTEEPVFNPADEDVTPAAPAKLPTPVKTEDPSESGATVLGAVGEYGADAAVGIARGAEDIVRGVRSNARALADVTGLAAAFGEGESIKEPLTYGTAEPQTAAGTITSSLTEAGLSWVIGGRVLAGVGAAVKSATIAGAAVQTGVGSLFTSDPHHQRLSNVLMEYPVIGPAFSLLAQDPEDPYVIAKAKSVVEESFTAAAAQGVFNALHLAVLKFRGAKPTNIAAAEAKVIDTQIAVDKMATLESRNVVASEDELAKLNAGTNFTKAQAATKQLLADSMGSDSVPAGSVFRGGSQAELDEILKTTKLVICKDAEGRPGISAEEISKSTRIQGEGVGYIAPKEALEGAGAQAGEFKINPNTDPKTLKFVVDGKILTYEELRTAKVVASAAAPAPTVKPVTIKTATGEPIVTLSENQSKRFQNLQDKLVIRDMLGQVHTPRQGLDESAAKQGVPLRPKYNDSPNAVLQGLADLGNMTKTQLGSKVVS